MKLHKVGYQEIKARPSGSNNSDKLCNKHWLLQLSGKNRDNYDVKSKCCHVAGRRDVQLEEERRVYHIAPTGPIYQSVSPPARVWLSPHYQPLKPFNSATVAV